MNERTQTSPENGPPSEGHEQGSSSRMLFAIALFKLAKAVVLVALGVGSFLLARDSGVLTTIREGVGLLGFNPHGQLVNRAASAALGVDHRRLQELGIGTFVYAAVFLVEGAGLLLRKHWAEYLTAIVTASFIPFEVYEMIHKPSVPKAIGIAVNVVVVVYLVVRLWRQRKRGDGGKQHNVTFSGTLRSP